MSEKKLTLHKAKEILRLEKAAASGDEDAKKELASHPEYEKFREDLQKSWEALKIPHSINKQWQQLSRLLREAATPDPALSKAIEAMNQEKAKFEKALGDQASEPFKKFMEEMNRATSTYEKMRGETRQAIPFRPISPNPYIARQDPNYRLAEAINRLSREMHDFRMEFNKEVSSKRQKRKNKHNLGTIGKINTLIENRERAISERGNIPSWIAACQTAKIRPETVIKHFPELRKKWDDFDFRPKLLD